MSLAGACSWDLEALHQALAENQDSSDAPEWYRVADGHLGLQCDHAPVTERWREIYHDCRTATPIAGQVSLHCRVYSGAETPFVRLDLFDPAPPADPLAFTLHTDPDQRYLRLAPQDGWSFLARSAEPNAPFAAFRDDSVLLDRAAPWEPFVAHYTFHRALRLQRDLMVFHAASVALNGRGVMLVGPKGAGKTTLSLMLAAMDGDFFGDEFAALRRSTHELVPFRRALSIRNGPTTSAVRSAVASGRYQPQPYPDGTMRFRIPPSHIVGPPRLQSAPLHAIFFLRTFVPQPAVTAFAPGLEHIRWLTPLGSTVADQLPSQTVRDFLGLLRRARCYFIDPGGAPEDTARAVLRSLEVV